MRAKKNIFASYLYIVVNILINLLVVRLTVKHYGDQIYAFVVIAFSFITYVETFNLGTFISNRTQIPMRGVDASVYTIATFKKLSIFVLGLIIIWLGFYSFYSSEFISLISSETNPVVINTGILLINIAVLYGLIKIPLTVVLSAFAGHDRVDIEKKYNGAQQLLKFSSLTIATTLNLSVISYFICFTILGVLILLVANIHYFKLYISHKAKRYFKYSKKISSLYITKSSIKFYIMTLTSVVVWSTDNLIVSIFLTPKLVTDYSINFAIYNAAFLFITAIGGALIANYGNLIRDKKYDVLNFRTNLSLYSTFIIASLIGFGGILFSRDIIQLWVGEGHHVSDRLILAFGLFGLTIGMTSVMNTILSLYAKTKVLVSMASGEALLNILLSVTLLKVIGIEGIAFATSIAALVTMLVPGIYLLNKAFDQQIQIQIGSILVQLALFSLFSFITYNLILSFLVRVAVFIVFVICVVVVTFFMKKEYFESYLKVFNK